ncbi:hypothetical protein Dimus_005696 [Dionaea muscipula]
MEQVGTSTSPQRIRLSPENAKSDEEIIDFTVGREQEGVEGAQKASESDLPDIPSLADDASLNNYLSALNQIEVSDENPMAMTSKGSKDVASPPRKKRNLRKGTKATTAKETEKGAMPAAVEQFEKSGVVARVDELEVQSPLVEQVDKGKKKDKGKKATKSTEKTMLLPELPGPAVKIGIHPTYYFPPWQLFGHHSMLQAAADKKMKEALRLEWAWGAPILWGEMSHRLEEKEKFIEGYGREFSTLKKSYESSIKNALDKSETVETKEKSTTEVAKLNENKLRAAEEKLQKAVDEAATY